MSVVDGTSAVRTAKEFKPTGSTGLGLAIVEAVTAAHGGRVEPTSRPGQTTFTVTLPTASSNSA